jgi:hypothetical protein
MYLPRAVDYLAGRDDWDRKALMVVGTRMGEQQTIVIADRTLRSPG